MDELGNTPGVRGNPGWKRCVAGGSSTTIGRSQGHLSRPRKLEAVINVRAISNSFQKRPRLVPETTCQKLHTRPSQAQLEPSSAPPSIQALALPCILHPLTRSQSIRNTSPKNVRKRYRRWASGNRYGCRLFITQPHPSITTRIPSSLGM